MNYRFIMERMEGDEKKRIIFTTSEQDNFRNDIDKLFSFMIDMNLPDYEEIILHNMVKAKFCLNEIIYKYDKSDNPNKLDISIIWPVCINGSDKYECRITIGRTAAEKAAEKLRGSCGDQHN